jgi:nitroimidazol reductase NimA-like FMN-containing flavoprotein (pyridoxamine 5'-phosphate oxidase superfamily)
LRDATLWGYLEVAKTMRLATVTGRSAIEVSPVWFVVRDETAYFAIDPVVGDPGRAATPASRHLAALDRDCRVSAVVDDGEDLTNFRGVQFAGKAAEVQDARLKDELVDLALEKYFYIGHPHLEAYLSTGMMDARRWFQLVADRVEGWDRRLLPQPPIMERRVLPPHLRKR